MQSLDNLDTLHYSLRGPASGNTSLPDVDSSRFAGCTSGARTVTSSRGLLGASWGPPGGLLGASLGLLGTSLGLSPPPFQTPSPSSLPALALIMGAAVTNFHLAGAAPQFAQGKRHYTPVVVWPFGRFFGASWRLLGDFLEASWGLLGAPWGLLGGLLGPLGAS